MNGHIQVPKAQQLLYKSDNLIQFSQIFIKRRQFNHDEQGNNETS